MQQFDSLINDIKASMGDVVQDWSQAEDKAVKDIERFYSEGVTFTDEALANAIGHLTDAYEGSVQAIAEFSEETEPERLFDLGFHHIQRGFEEFAEQSREMMQRAGMSPAVLREMGHDNLEQLLEAGADYASDITLQAMGYREGVAGMRTETERRLGAEKALAEQRAGEQKTGLTKWAGSEMKDTRLKTATGKTLARQGAWQAMEGTLGKKAGFVERLAESHLREREKKADIYQRPDWLGYERSMFPGFNIRGTSTRSTRAAEEGKGKGWNYPHHALSNRSIDVLEQQKLSKVKPGEVLKKRNAALPMT
jgi:hypothetical protein